PSASRSLLLDEPAPLVPYHDQRLAAPDIQIVRTVPLLEADDRSVLVLERDLGRFNGDLDLFGAGDAFFTRCFPFRARFALRRLEILSVEGEIAFYVLLGPRACPGEHRLQYGRAFALLRARRPFRRLCCRRFYLSGGWFDFGGLRRRGSCCQTSRRTGK